MRKNHKEHQTPLQDGPVFSENRNDLPRRGATASGPPLFQGPHGMEGKQEERQQHPGRPQTGVLLRGWWWSGNALVPVTVSPERVCRLRFINSRFAITSIFPCNLGEGNSFPCSFQFSPDLSCRGDCLINVSLRVSGTRGGRRTHAVPGGYRPPHARGPCVFTSTRDQRDVRVWIGRYNFWEHVL